MGLAAAGAATGVAVGAALPKEKPKMDAAAMKKLVDAPIQMDVSNRGRGFNEAEKRPERIWASKTFHKDGSVTYRYF